MAFLQLVPLALSASILGLLALLFRRRKPLSFLQGPPVSSWLLGHEYELTNQREVGDLEFKWFQDYGTVFRGAGCCGEETLMVSDVDALHHILDTGGYRYPKTKDDERSSEQITGRGLAWAQGATHKRHRKALNPAFTESQLRTFVPLFQMYADKLALRWRERFADSQIIDVSKWLQNTTLDVLGESTFGFHFEALDDKASDLQISIQKIFANSRQPSKLMTLWRTWKRLLPDPVVDYIASAYVTEEDARSRLFLELAKGSARDSLARKGLNADGEKRSNNQSNMRGVEGKKDILNMLLRSMEDPKKRLDEDEVLSQVSTMVFAGYELTAMTLTWILYELSRNLNDQRRLRGEIDAILAEKGKNAMLTANDYDSMPFLNACVKEGLRLRPGVQFTTREADLDDVIPLAQPVISTSGEMLKKIPVIKGQRVHISIAAYNRSPSIWGSDSDQWNPSRFLRLESTKQQSSIGVFGNVLSFGSGVRGCIGWRFAVIEMQAILVGLLSQFEFQIPPAGLDIHAVPLKTMNVPMVRGELDKGLQMPLVVKRRSIS